MNSIKRTFIAVLAGAALVAFGAGCEEDGNQEDVQPGQEEHVGQAAQQGQTDQDTGLEQDQADQDAQVGADQRGDADQPDTQRQPDAQTQPDGAATGGGPTPSLDDDSQKARGEDAARQGSDPSGDRPLEDQSD